MNIYLIRHSAVYNPNKLCYGQSEIPLEENFTADFDWIQEHLNLKEDTLYYSSPFRRCTKLASFLSNDTFEIDKRITELNFGNWEMKAWDKIPEKELNPWMEDFVNHRMKNGENFNDLYERSVEFYQDITNANTQNLVILTHAGVIRSLTSYVLDFPLEKAFNLQVDYSSVSKFEYDAKNDLSKVVYLNLNATNIGAAKKIITD
ncbi:alpha-ribazole phosphatase [Pedobacter cryophilus]|uniref:Alpha-ribazole phosphatase n=1 Tax=Pedobacter cryophilus TaxID=2571271 RepID=A0A4U1BWV6_9SPHI|nr:alpha-ribazole phosphatase [Pedobacter cryophilus]TKB95903.1 alpha-ribazole phosphatase [Pedobacter cryophilus]